MDLCLPRPENTSRYSDVSFVTTGSVEEALVWLAASVFFLRLHWLGVAVLAQRTYLDLGEVEIWWFPWQQEKWLLFYFQC